MPRYTPGLLYFKGKKTEITTSLSQLTHWKSFEVLKSSYIVAQRI